MGLVVTLINPRYWVGGLLGGAFLGCAYSQFRTGLSARYRGNTGSKILIPGMTEEQRLKQDQKDHIHQLSLQQGLGTPVMKNL